MKTILSAKKVCKSYTLGQRKHDVLKDIDLEITEGEFLSVMGPSGSGKSTLLYNVSGMDRPDSGHISFCSNALLDLSEEALSKVRLERMGFVFQQSHLLKNLNLLDNILLPAYTRKKEPRNAINDRALKLMKEMGISELADNNITQASGGQLQRASICRALINQPDILFGDEPTGALNSKATDEVMTILKGIHEQGKTIMLVTHDPSVAAKTERILFMKDGIIVDEKFLGKLDDSSDYKERESELTSWLIEKGF